MMTELETLIHYEFESIVLVLTWCVLYVICVALNVVVAILIYNLNFEVKKNNILYNWYFYFSKYNEFYNSKKKRCYQI